MKSEDRFCLRLTDDELQQYTHFQHFPFVITKTCDVAYVAKEIFAASASSSLLQVQLKWSTVNEMTSMLSPNGGGDGVHTLTVVITVAIINDTDMSKRRGPTTTVLTRARRSKHNSRTTPRKSHREPEKVCERLASAIAVTEHCEIKKQVRLTLWVRLEAHRPTAARVWVLLDSDIYHGREATTPTAASRLTAFIFVYPIPVH